MFQLCSYLFLPATNTVLKVGKTNNKLIHLQETGPVGNNSHDEWKRDEYAASVASVFSLFEITPAVVANVELKTSQGLHLSTQKGQINTWKRV